MTSDALRIRDMVAAELVDSGFDLVHSFDAARYNAHVAQHPTLAPLPLFGRPRALGLLIGNTKALWPRFVGACRASRNLRDDPHPLDRYTADVLRVCANGLPARTELRFSHEGGQRLVSMLHLAEASGFAKVGPVHLAVHPEHGPWFALRAVIVLDVEPPMAAPLEPPDPCRGCPAPCSEALARALAASAANPPPDVAATWRAWVAVRDACPLGRSSRYEEDQLRYHYTKDRSALTAGFDLEGR